MEGQNSQFFKTFTFSGNDLSGITTIEAGDFGYKEQTVTEEKDRNYDLISALGGNCFLKIEPEHGDEIVERKKISLIENYCRGDAIIWQDRKDGAHPVLMSITGDCPTLTIQGTDILAIVHSGRKGTELGIVPKVIDLLEVKYGQEPGALKCYLWPGICRNCYELEEELVSTFPKGSITGRGKVKLDLRKVIMEQLMSRRIAPKNFYTPIFCSFCTRENNDFLFHSQRREKNQKRNVVFITKK